MVFGAPESRGDHDIGEYVAELEESIRESHEVARKTLRTSQERMKRDYDLRVNVRSYSVGDCVYILDTATVKGKCRKLSPLGRVLRLLLGKLHHTYIV